MANYVELARQALEAPGGTAGPDPPGETKTPGLSRDGGPETGIPPAAQWPESLSKLAAEVGQRSGDPEEARREVWMNWCEWKAAALNRLLQEQGVTGQPGRITAETVRHGERKMWACKETASRREEP